MPLKPGDRKKFKPSNTNVEARFDKFLSDCSEGIAAMKQANKFLYRGIDSTNVPSIFVGKPRENRNALDTPNSVAEAFDEILSSSGFKALRSNSIFCSGDINQASGYASLQGGWGGVKNVFMIFPKNGFSLTWSPKIRDFTNKMNNMSVYDSEDLLNIGLDQKNNPNLKHFKNIEKIAENINKKSFSMDVPYNLRRELEDYSDDLCYECARNNLDMDALKKLLITINEIEKAYPIKIISNGEMHLLTLALSGQLIKKIEIDKSAIISKLEYTNQDLTAALNAKVEVCIRGEYYAFRCSEYLKSLTNAILKS